MATEPPPLLDELLRLATHFSGRPAQNTSRINADLDINGSDFIELVEVVEGRYGVNLDWVSPAGGSGKSAHDPTVEALAAYILQHMRCGA